MNRVPAAPSRGIAILRCLCTIAAAACCTTVNAEGDSGGSLTVVSDSVYRGLSQTRGQLAIQVGAYGQFAQYWSIGAALSSVDLGDWIDASYEISASLNRDVLISDHWSARASYVYYSYPEDRGEYDYEEWIATLTYRDRISATIAYSPNASIYSYGRTTSRKSATSYELSALHPISERWSAVAGLGYYDLSEAFDTGYRFWSAGLLFSINSLQLDLLRIDTDSTALRLFGSERAGGRWSAAIMWKF